MNILIAEDEQRLNEALKQIMKENKYLADCVYDGQSAIDYAMLKSYDVIILDVMLPKKDGFEVVDELRKEHNNVPILLLTAKTSVQDKVTGLNLGADDYMTKPFSVSELLARVNALSRRHGEIRVEQLEYLDLKLDLSSAQLFCHEDSVQLCFKEFEILKMLLLQPENTISKETLIERIWGSESNAEANNVEVYISFLRKKMHFLNSTVTIKTLRKLGYRLQEIEK